MRVCYFAAIQNYVAMWQIISKVNLAQETTGVTRDIWGHTEIVGWTNGWISFFMRNTKASRILVLSTTLCAYRLNPDILQLLVDTKHCILMRLEWAFNSYCESCHTFITSSKYAKYTVWSLEDQDMLYPSWRMSVMSLLSLWKHKAI